MKTYYTVVNEDCVSCGHKHRAYNRAVDCFDKLVDFTPCDEEPIILEVKSSIPLEAAAFTRAAWMKYGKDGEQLQGFANRWTN